MTSTPFAARSATTRSTSSGISYGTRSALTFLQRHPKSVHTLLLEGPLPPENPMPLYAGRDAQSVLDRIIADCKCGGRRVRPRFPTSPAIWRESLAALDAKPARFNAGDYHVTMSRGEFGEFLRSQMYAADRQRLIPLMIHLAAAGDWSWIGKYWLRYRDGWYDDIGVFLSISCPGDIRWIDHAAIRCRHREHVPRRLPRAAADRRLPGVGARPRASRHDFPPSTYRC